MRKFLIFILFLMLLLSGAYVFRYPILRFFATHLIQEDPLQKADALFVLSGGGYDRGNEAVKLFHTGYAPLIICTGGNEATEFKVFDIDTLESDCTVANLRRQHIPDSVIVEIREGTSTKEESHIIDSFCVAKHYKKVIILSSKIHTYRVNDVFRKLLKKDGIDLIVRGAASSTYEETKWWKSENGMIAINNEWIKNFYYWWKY